MNDPLHKLDAHYASLDELALVALFEEATREREADVLEPGVRQLVLRAVPVVERTVREFGEPRGLQPSDLRLVEEEALTKLVLRLQRRLPLPSIRVLAYEIARACAEDPERRAAPASKAGLARPTLRAVNADRSPTHLNGYRRGRNYG